MLRVFLETGQLSKCESLQRVISSGEALTAELKERFRGRMGCGLYNLYGPTEAAVDVSWFECQAEQRAEASVPIGRPIWNVRLYILDEQQQLLPVGVSGELYISGVALGRGYSRRPELTAEKFVPDPHSTEAGARMYRTGDVGRYRGDGVIEYLGRTDEQVKVRGYRVELGEIEAVLESHRAVRESAAVVREGDGGEKKIVGYYVKMEGEAVGGGELRGYLKERLPEYMVPAVFVELEALPQTSSGKIDRKALPAPGRLQLEREKGFVAPSTRVERTLAGVWSELLGLEQVGLHDNFFEIGGDSIRGIQMVSRAQQRGLHLTPLQLFQAPTIAQLAPLVNSSPTVYAEQGIVTGALPLIPIQHWFFEQQLSAPSHWNQSLLLETEERLDGALLREALAAILRQHDALRLRFRRSDRNWSQYIEALEAAEIVLEVELRGVSDEAEAEVLAGVCAQVQESLSIEEGPLMRAAVLRRAGRDLLLLAVHHLAIDGVSWRILIEDLQSAYHQLSDEQPLSLPPKSSSIKEWAERLLSYAHSPRLAAQAQYWLQALPVAIPALPLDHSRGENTEASRRSLSVSLSQSETQALLQDVGPAYHTQINDLLLTGLVEGYRRWSGEREMLVDFEGHGREEEVVQGVDISRTVGWFTTIYPLCLRLPKANDPGAALQQIKEQLRQIPQHGIGYGLLHYLHEDSALANKLRQRAQAEVLFNYLGQVDHVLPQSSTFKLARESAGPLHDPMSLRRYKLEVEGIVADGRLHVTWNYSGNLHRRMTIQQLADDFLKSLRALITHCLSTGVRRFTPSDFPLAALDQSRLDQLLGHEDEVEDVYPLSPMQQGMLFHSLYAPESGFYVEQSSHTVHAKLNLEALKGAWQRVMDRHTALRTRFIWEGLEEPLQIVHRRVKLALEEQDWQTRSISEQQERLEVLLAEDLRRGFDLSRVPLSRLMLIRLDEKRYQFIWTIHHLVVDGWAMSLLLKEVFALYDALCQGADVQLALSRPYRDYIAWLQRQDSTAAEEYWRRTLRGFKQPTPLPESSGLEQPGEESGYGEVQCQMSESATVALQALARRHQLTLNNIVQGAWALLLSHNSGMSDIVFGTVLSGRPSELVGFESMIGLFINTLPLRIRVRPEESLVAWLKGLQEQQGELLQYQYSSLMQVQAGSDVTGGLPLFESILIFESYPVNAALREQSESLGIRNVRSSQQTHYPLAVVVAPGRKLSLLMGYYRSRFATSTAARLLKDFETLLEGMVAGDERRLLEMMMLLRKPESSTNFVSSSNLVETYKDDQFIF